jgi:UDP-N-acetylmuramate--alanine ligase
MFCPNWRENELYFDLIKDKNKKVHFIGIGGISMSGLAEILLKNGFSVSGSDMKHSPISDKLSKDGAKIFYGHFAENVEDADLVVYTAAISADNPELLRARALNIPLMDRAEFLGELMKGHKYNLAVAGTHGKTTTTSMVSHIIMEANLDPTILVGGELDLIDGNFRIGKSEYFITEACEYKGSFLKFHPYTGIILNIDEDHLDYFKDINHIIDTFKSFAQLIPKEGYLIGYAEDPHLDKVIENANCNIITYGFDKGDLTADNITFNERGCATFDVIRNGLKVLTVSLNVPGKHNILNALASCAAALAFGISKTSISNGLNNYKGTHKRFEIKGVKNGVTVIDDYAHHPTEIKAFLAAAKNYPHKKIYCVFQPHTYTRTLALFEDFANSFYDADEVVLAEIYAAREKDNGKVSSAMLGDRLREKGVNCKNFKTFAEIVNYIKDIPQEGDLLLTVGAGDIVKVGEDYLTEK